MHACVLEVMRKKLTEVLLCIYVISTKVGFIGLEVVYYYTYIYLYFVDLIVFVFVLQVHVRRKCFSI